MSDIVERLRDPSSGSPRWLDTMNEAAGEIEKLRAAVMQAARYVDNLASERYALQAENERLRAALGEKE